MAKNSIPQRGVYAIQCADGRCYVGSSICLAARRSYHLSSLRKRKHHNRLLQAAWDALGCDQFEFVVLEESPTGDLLPVEQKWMDLLRAATEGFNLSPTAGRCNGVVHSPETRARVSAALCGGVQSPESNAKRRASLSGENGPNAKVREEDVREIRRRAETGETFSAIAAEYALQRQTVSMMVRRMTWACVE